MLQVLLFILKAIGIVLLCMIVFLVLLAACILLIPVRYRIYGHKYDDICSRINITWFLHLLYAKVDIHKQDEAELDLHIVLKVFGFSLYDNLKPRRKWRREKKLSDDKEVIKSENQEAAVKTTYENKEAVHTKDKLSEDDSHKNIFHKITAAIKKIRLLIRKIIDKVQSLKNILKQSMDKIKVLRSKKDKLIEIMTSDENKPTFRKLKRRVIKILNHIKPRKVKGEIYFGLDNPANTGYTLAIVSMIYPIYANRLKFYPDFEKSVFKGELYIKGRIRLSVLLWYSLTLLIDKNVRRILKTIKKI